MVNNTTKINKANNYLSAQSIVPEKTMTYSDVNPDPGLGQAQNKTNFLTYLPSGMHDSVE